MQNRLLLLRAFGRLLPEHRLASFPAAVTAGILLNAAVLSYQSQKAIGTADEVSVIRNRVQLGHKLLIPGIKIFIRGILGGGLLLSEPRIHELMDLF